MFWQANEPDINTNWNRAWFKVEKNLPNLFPIYYKPQCWKWRGEIHEAAAGYFLVGLVRRVYILERKRVRDFVLHFYSPAAESRIQRTARYLLTRKADKRGWYENLLWIHASEWERRQRPVRPQLIASTWKIESKIVTFLVQRTEIRANACVQYTGRAESEIEFFLLPPAHIAAEKEAKSAIRGKRTWMEACTIAARRAAANCCRHAGLRSPNYAEYAKCNLTALPNLHLARAHHCEITRNCEMHVFLVSLIWNTLCEVFANQKWKW